MSWFLIVILMIFGLTVQAADSQRLTIAMIPKGTTHVFWKSVEAGARAAAKDLDVDLVWKGPLK